jgi:hypothetical protein
VDPEHGALHLNPSPGDHPLQFQVSTNGGISVLCGTSDLSLPLSFGSLPNPPGDYEWPRHVAAQKQYMDEQFSVDLQILSHTSPPDPAPEPEPEPLTIPKLSAPSDHSHCSHSVVSVGILVLLMLFALYLCSS